MMMKSVKEKRKKIFIVRIFLTNVCDKNLMVKSLFFFAKKINSTVVCRYVCVCIHHKSFSHVFACVCCFTKQDCVLSLHVHIIDVYGWMKQLRGGIQYRGLYWWWHLMIAMNLCRQFSNHNSKLPFFFIHSFERLRLNDSILFCR